MTELNKSFLVSVKLIRLLKPAFSDAIMAALFARDEDYKRQKQERGLKDTE